MNVMILIVLFICFDQVELAVQAVRDSDILLKDGKLEEAFLKSRSAIVASGETVNTGSVLTTQEVLAEI